MRAFKSAGASLILAALLVVGPGGSGCSSRHVEHQESTETVRSGDVGAEYSRTETQKSTEVEHESSGPACSGVLSCLVGAIGEVLAFPFRAIGYIFQALF